MNTKDLIDLAKELGFRDKTGNYNDLIDLTLVQNWLRETHNLFISIHLDQTTEPKYCYSIYSYEDFGNYTNMMDGPNSDLYYSYINCLFEAIEHTLKFLKK